MNERSRIEWQCRRGMRELDVLLENFVVRHYDELNGTQKALFESLLAYPDPILLEYLMGRMVPLDKDIADVVVKVRRATVA